MTRRTYRSFEIHTAVADSDRAAEIAKTTSPFQIDVRFIQGHRPLGPRSVLGAGARRAPDHPDTHPRGGAVTDIDTARTAAAG
ncbi:hypothetical protein [Streptomyces narbonensis]|uniref:hypothetical protein n=1 Tax=Streptomyces narbonensis TaxID=67333 RepID=UPI0033D54AC5